VTEPQFPVELSVLVPVGNRHDEASEIHAEYRKGLDALGRSYELIYVLDGARDEFAAGLRSMLEQGERFSVVSLTRPFGEAAAIMSGFQQARGQLIVTLPAYRQVDARDFRKLIAALENCDVAVGRRWPRAGGPFDRARRAAFHGLLGSITGSKFRDLGCGVRALHRRVLDEIQLYGDQHRFLAVIADRQGFNVQEIDLRQSERDRFKGMYGPRDYIRGFLDIFTIFFLVRFTKKPLRFFGMIGVTLLLVGAILVTWLVIERLFFDQPLADRPAILLSTLLLVLGLQLFALGLLGELIIFTHARSIKDYQIERVIHYSPGAHSHPQADHATSGDSAVSADSAPR
jgi:glycosyltransferase involved in cell wall biosynthesis